MYGMRKTVQSTSDSVLRVSRRLIEARNSQLNYITEKRNIDKVIAFILSTDLVIQYNHVHRLGVKFREEFLKHDICANDGGIMCCNLSVALDTAKDGDGDSERLKGLAIALPPVRDPATAYVISRTVELLDRSVTIGDETPDLNVDHGTAAKVRALELLFKERYRLCRERNERLQQELDAVQQQLMAGTGPDNGETMPPQLRERVGALELQFDAIRKQLERLQDVGEESARGGQQHIQLLIRQPDQFGNYNQPLVTLLENLCSDVATEYGRASDISLLLQSNGLAARLVRCKEEKKRCNEELARLRDELAGCLRRAESMYTDQDGKRLQQSLEGSGKELTRGIQWFADGVESLSQSPYAVPDPSLAKELDERVQAALSARVLQTIAPRLQQLEERAEKEIATRVKKLEAQLRSGFNKDFDSRRGELESKWLNAFYNYENKIAQDSGRKKKGLEMQWGSYGKTVLWIEELRTIAMRKPEKTSVWKSLHRVDGHGAAASWSHSLIDKSAFLGQLVYTFENMFKVFCLQDRYIVLLEYMPNVYDVEKRHVQFQRMQIISGQAFNDFSVRLTSELGKLLDSIKDLSKTIEEIRCNLETTEIPTKEMSRGGEYYDAMKEHEKMSEEITSLLNELHLMRHKDDPNFDLDLERINDDKEAKTVRNNVFRNRWHVVEEMKSFGRRVYKEYKEWYTTVAGAINNTEGSPRYLKSFEDECARHVFVE